MKTVLSIQSQVAAGRVGNSVATFVLERLGVEVNAVPTTLFGRRPDRGRPGGRPTPPDLMADMLAGLEADGRLSVVDAVLSGYIGEPDQAAIVLSAVNRVKRANPRAVYICDPVMGEAPSPAQAPSDRTGFFVSQDVADAIVHSLVPAADLVTPNAWEMQILTGLPIRDANDAHAGALALAKPSLVTSTPRPNGVGVCYASAAEAWLAATPFAPRAPKGSGDLLTALFLARRLQGHPVRTALELAVGGAYDVIVRSLDRPDGDLALVEAQDVFVVPVTRPEIIPMAR